MRRMILGALIIALGSMMFTGAATGATSSDRAGGVDDARLLSAPADAHDWITAGGSYANRHFSALAQIDRTTVAQLAPRWSFHSGLRGGFETTPLVVDGVMYLTTPYDDVVALDAASGVVRWRYHHVLKHKPCCGPANRGAAVGYGRVYIATVDARLIALDQATGAIVWDTSLAGEAGGKIEAREALAKADALRGQQVIGETGIFANMAPLVYAGKVLVGVTGVGYGLHLGSQATNDAHTSGVVGFAGDYGHRGYYAAFDAATGHLDWRWYTIRERGWEGAFRQTTPDGAPLPGRDAATERASIATYRDAWKTGGGSAWTTPAFDPKLGLLYLGVGNPSPQFADSTRPGDNLDSVSLVALDATTGKERWAFQQVPHDLWGYDVASPPVLFDTTVAGRTVPAVAQAGKTGWLYIHDRRTGELLVKSEPFVAQHNLFAQPTSTGISIQPAAFGGASWSPVAYDSSSGLAYVAGVNAPMTYRLHTTDAAGSQNYTEAVAAPPAERSGTLTAIDTQTGKIRWQATTAQPLLGGVLATAGGIVFTGEGNGRFDAFDAASGNKLWNADCGAGVNAPPIAYEVGGTEYIAVAAGGNALFGYPQGDGLLVFALPR